MIPSIVTGAGATTGYYARTFVQERVHEGGMGLITLYTLTDEKRTRYRCARDAYRSVID